MKRMFVFLSIILVVFLVSGCNADILEAFGEWSVGFRDAGLADVGASRDDDAVEASESLMALMEKSLGVSSSLTVRYDISVSPLLGLTKSEMSPTGAYELECEVFLYPGAKDAVLQGISDYIRKIAMLSDVQGAGNALRSRLSAASSGKTGSRPCHKNLYDIVTGSETYVKELLPLVNSTLVPITMGDIYGLKKYYAPIPLQTYDFSLLFPPLKKLYLDYQDVAPEEEDPLFLEKLKDFFSEFLDEIENSVGDRDYKTICDEFTVFIVLGMIQDLDQILLERVAYGARFGTPDDISWILSNCSEELDGILGGIDAIAYMYGIECDSCALITRF